MPITPDLLKKSTTGRQLDLSRCKLDEGDQNRLINYILRHNKIKSVKLPKKCPKTLKENLINILQSKSKYGVIPVFNDSFAEILENKYHRSDIFRWIYEGRQVLFSEHELLYVNHVIQEQHDTLQQKILRNDAEAMMTMAFLKYYGVGVEIDESSAFLLADQASSLNYRYADYIKGLFYYYSRKTDDHLEKAIACFESAATPPINQKNCEALAMLAFIYSYGIGETVVDFDKALALFEQAIEAGSIATASKLGLQYLAGFNQLEQDFVKSSQLFTIAAAAGDNEAMHNLSILQEHGLGTAPSTPLESKEYRNKAAAFGNTSAMIDLGNSCLKNVRPDFAKAKAYFGRAAILRDERAFSILARMYANGEGCKPDLVKARYLQAKAAAPKIAPCDQIKKSIEAFESERVHLYLSSKDIRDTAYLEQFQAFEQFQVFEQFEAFEPFQTLKQFQAFEQFQTLNQYNKLNDFKNYLEENTDILEQVTSKGYTALHAAVDYGLNNIAIYILSKKPDLLMALSHENESVLHIAAQMGNWQLAQFFSRKEPKLTEITDLDGNLPLHDAAYFGHQKVAEVLAAENHPALHKENGEEETPLMVAVWQGHFNLLRPVYIKMDVEVISFVAKMLSDRKSGLTKNKAEYDRYQHYLKQAEDTITTLGYLSASQPKKQLNEFCYEYSETVRPLYPSLINSDCPHMSSIKFINPHRNKKACKGKKPNIHEPLESPSDEPSIPMTDYSDAIKEKISALVEPVRKLCTIAEIRVILPRLGKKTPMVEAETLKYHVFISCKQTPDILKQALANEYHLPCDYGRKQPNRLFFTISINEVSALKPASNLVSTVKQLLSNRDDTPSPALSKSSVDKHIGQLKNALNKIEKIIPISIEKTNMHNGQVTISHPIFKQTPCPIRIEYQHITRSGKISTDTLNRLIGTHLQHFALDNKLEKAESSCGQKMVYQLYLPKTEIKWNIDDWVSQFIKQIRQNWTERKAGKEKLKPETDQDKIRSEKPSTARKEKVGNLETTSSYIPPNEADEPAVQPQTGSKADVDNLETTSSYMPSNEADEPSPTASPKVVVYNPKRFLDTLEPKEESPENSTSKPNREKGSSTTRIFQAKPAIKMNGELYKKIKQQIVNKLPVFMEYESSKEVGLDKKGRNPFYWAYLMYVIRICALDILAYQFDKSNRIFENLKDAKQIRLLIHHMHVLNKVDKPLDLLRQLLIDICQVKGTMHQASTRYQFKSGIQLDKSPAMKFIIALIQHSPDMPDAYYINEIKDSIATIHETIDQIETSYGNLARKDRTVPPQIGDDHWEFFVMELEVLAMQIVRLVEGCAKLPTPAVEWLNDKKSPLTKKDALILLQRCKEVRNFLAHDNLKELSGDSTSFIGGKLEARYLFDLAKKMQSLYVREEKIEASIEATSLGKSW